MSDLASEIASIEELELTDRRVLMRLDLNVPLRDGAIVSDARIRAALPTIEFAHKAGAILFLCSHLGRPQGKPSPELSLEPVGVRLSELLDCDVLVTDDCIGDGVKGVARELRPGAVVLLENLRFHAGETKNDPDFVRRLVAPFDSARDVYINDAFGACHRSHAWIVGAAAALPERGAGFLLAQETKALDRLLNSPPRPFVAIVGGAKVSDKLGVLGALMSRVDTLCIGGAMAYTFLAAMGVSTGDSRVEEQKLSAARELMKRGADRGVKILLPTDHVVADRFAEDAAPMVVADQAIPAGKMALDIGPKTRTALAAQIAGAKTIFWNGPMGVFEWQAFAAGTRSVAEAVAESDAYSLVGGGDSVAAIEQMKVSDRVSHVSTGGGASIEYLEHGKLPGIEALRRRQT